MNMSANLPDTPRTRIDPDDTPELTDGFFENGVWRIGELVVSPPDGVAAFVQARMNRACGSLGNQSHDAILAELERSRQDWAR